MLLPLLSLLEQLVFQNTIQLQPLSPHGNLGKGVSFRNWNFSEQMLAHNWPLRLGAAYTTVLPRISCL